MNPVLSIAIPGHNEAKYIGRCIESIAASARLAAQPVEIIVALNRCTDPAQAIPLRRGALMPGIFIERTCFRQAAYVTLQVSTGCQRLV